ncbi:hypothetical protein GCM10022222_71390 [Amycolatopsis ultiminotia]|uniref:Uncharacterized protein n=1 Tax=Amycolatopsis ultiminotia TaxID=543629 RepID=A0ABP6Y721_9PSEU
MPILVGDDDTSAGYIRIKQRQAVELDNRSPHTHIATAGTPEQLSQAILATTRTPACTGS